MPSNKNQKDTNEADFVGRLRYPRRDEGELFGIVTQLMGANKVLVMCQDGKVRSCRIPGKLRKKVWVRVNDTVIVKIWEFQKEKGDIQWRFLGHQVEWMKRKGILQGLPF